MTLSKLTPTTIGVSLVAFLSLMTSLSPSVLSLKTGYDYDTKENPTTAEQYIDLKCTYLFAAMTHMRLTKLILDDKIYLNGFAVGLVRNYDVRAAICTLYDVADVEIGSLWLFLLYESIVQNYYERYVIGSDNEAGRIVALGRLVVIHVYVMERMQRELSATGCRPGNQFDSYEERYKRQVAYRPCGVPFYKGIQKEAIDNCEELDILLKANNAQSTYGTRYEAMKAKKLFVNNLGINKPLKSKLMTTYDVQVNWDGTSRLLEDDYINARKIYSPTNWLFSIKKYYRGVFSLFKVLVYRLTWRFLLNVNTFTGERRENHLKKWHDLLVEFQILLCLEDDPDVKALLGAIKKQSSVNISNQLEDNLQKMNDYLQCVATKQMILKSEQSSLSSHQDTTDQAKIDLNSVKNVQNFIAQLRIAFLKVDFDVIRSIVTYISDETKW